MIDLKQFLVEGQRKLGTRRTILYIDPKKFEPFFQALEKSDLPTELKAFISLSLSGGCRASETLSLQLSHIQDGRIVDLKVLKKRREFTSVHTGHKVMAEYVYRSFDLHPTTLKYLAELSEGHRRYDKLFTLSLSGIYKALRKVFGKGFCGHSLRHSHISFRLHVKKQSVEEIKERLKIDIKTVDAYNHVNTKEREGLWD